MAALQLDGECAQLKSRPDCEPPIEATTIISRSPGEWGLPVYEIQIGDVRMPDIHFEEILEYVSAYDLEVFENAIFKHDREAEERAQLALRDARRKKRELKWLTRNKEVVFDGASSTSGASVSAGSQNAGSPISNGVNTGEESRGGRPRPTYTHLYKKKRNRRPKDPNSVDVRVDVDLPPVSRGSHLVQPAPPPKSRLEAVVIIEAFATPVDVGTPSDTSSSGGSVTKKRQRLNKSSTPIKPSLIKASSMTLACPTKASPIKETSPRDAPTLDGTSPLGPSPIKASSLKASPMKVTTTKGSPTRPPNGNSIAMITSSPLPASSSPHSSSTRTSMKRRISDEDEIIVEVEQSPTKTAKVTELALTKAAKSADHTPSLPSSLTSSTFPKASLTSVAFPRKPSSLPSITLPKKRLSTLAAAASPMTTAPKSSYSYSQPEISSDSESSSHSSSADEAGSYEIERILAHKLSDPSTHGPGVGSQPVTLYKVKWTGYATTSWEPESSFDDREVVDEYWALVRAKEEAKKKKKKKKKNKEGPSKRGSSRVGAGSSSGISVVA